MTAPETIFVRHQHTGEIREVTPAEREDQDKNYWVRITGDDVKAAPAADVDTAVTPEGDADGEVLEKTTSKATPPKK